MATNHDIRSYECQRIFLENFRSGKWTNSIFSKDLVLQRTNKSWPSEDGNIIDSSTGLNIALEFKPKIETKRGIQTGLGQCFPCSVSNKNKSFPRLRNTIISRIYDFKS